MFVSYYNYFLRKIKKKLFFLSYFSAENPRFTEVEQPKLRAFQTSLKLFQN